MTLFHKTTLGRCHLKKKLPSGFFSTNNGRTDHERNCLQKEKVKTVEFWSKNQIFGVRIQDLRWFWEFNSLVHDPKTQNFRAPAARNYSYEYFSEIAKFSHTAAPKANINLSLPNPGTTRTTKLFSDTIFRATHSKETFDSYYRVFFVVSRENRITYAQKWFFSFTLPETVH